MTTENQAPEGAELTEDQIDTLLGDHDAALNNEQRKAVHAAIRAALVAQPQPSAEAQAQHDNAVLERGIQLGMYREQQRAAATQSPAEGDVLRDGAEAVAVEAYQHALNGGHIQDLYKLPQRCAARAAHQPQPKGAALTDAHIDGIALQWENERFDRQLGDGTKATFCEFMDKRLRHFARAVIAADRAARVPAPGAEAPAGCYPEEWGPSSDRKLTCACGNPDPAHWEKT